MTSFPEGSPAPLPGRRTDHFRVEGPVTTLERAWALLGDTDWLNRAGENGAVLAMTVSPQGDGFPMVTGQLAGPAGTRVPFQEVWSSWVVGRFFRQVRDLRSPFASRSDYRAELTEAPGGVRPSIEMWLSGPAWASPLRRLGVLAGMQRRWAAALAALSEGDPIADRPLGAEAQAAILRWREHAPAEVIDRVAAHFRHGRPTDLVRMRAFSLADQWSLPRMDVLEALLAGVEVGATEIFWSARCRRCYAQLSGGRTLSDLADHVDCPACGIRTDTDLGESVEVLFAPHPSVVTAVEMNFCTMFPAMAPAQQAVFTLAPRQVLRAEVPLPPGRWKLGPGQGQPDLEVEATTGGDTELRWETGETGARTVRAGKTTVEVHNDEDVRRRVFLVRAQEASPVVHASLVTTMDRFRRRMGHQVLSTDLRVGVRSVTLLFTDLGGSTAMYEELGDAQAYAVVRDHFTLLRGIAAAEGGTVVKTIGDAVMAAFFSTPAAVRAALEMIDRFAAYAGGLGLAHPPTLKVGVHAGAALAVHTDQSGLDYFGGTVNLAARAQGAAGGGELMLTDAVKALPEVAMLLDGRRVEEVTAALKGIGDVRLWRVRR